MQKYQKILIVLSIIFLLVGGSFFGIYLHYRKVIINSWTNLKIGFVTDFEYANRKKIGNKLPKQAIPELEKIANYFNNEFKPDIVIEGGDMIESSTTHKLSSKESRFREINEAFLKIQARKEYVLGNHDLRALSKEQFRRFAGMEDNHKYFDLNGWRFVIMDTNFDEKGQDMGPTFYAGSYVSENETKWLEEAINTEKPTIIFSHHPFLPLEKKNLINADEVISVLEKRENVIMTVSGHDPSFYFNEQNGTAYLVVDNIANEDSVGSFATFETEYNKYTEEAKIKMEHYGPTRETREIYKKIGTGITFKEYLSILFQSIY